MREPKTSPTADTRSVAVSTSQPPADLPEPVQACCPACGARSRFNSRFCSDCGTAQAPATENEAAAIRSQLGGSSADLAELLAAQGQVVSCPRCDELNNASAAWCRHCGQQLPAPEASATLAEDMPPMSETHNERRKGRIPSAAQHDTLWARRYWPGIALMALLGVAVVTLWLERSATGPASEPAHSATLPSVPALPPVETIVSTPVVEPVAALLVAPLPAPGASSEEPDKASPSASSPGGQKRVGAVEHARKKVAKTAVLRASAPIGIDELYRQRAAERCPQGLSGLICRQKLRFELCDGKWTQEAQSGMETCRLNG